MICTSLFQIRYWNKNIIAKVRSIKFINLNSEMFILTQVLAYLLVTSVAAVIEILNLAYRGEKDVTWSEAYSKYGNFCNKMITSLLLQMVALLCFFVLQVISAHRVFSNFEAPFLASKEGEEQREWHDFFLCNFFSGDSDIILSYKDCLFDTKFMNEHISED